MGFWKNQNKNEKQIRLSYAIKKTIAQLEKRRAQLENQFRKKYMAAQEAKTLGDKEEAIRLLEECQIITDEQDDIKKELSRLSRAESLIEYLIILPEVSEVLGTTSSAEEIDPAKVLGIVSSLEDHIKQTREADEKLGVLPEVMESQELPALPIEKTVNSDTHEVPSTAIDLDNGSDPIKKNHDTSKKRKKTEL